jgi:hypothetical protein
VRPPFSQPKAGIPEALFVGFTTGSQLVRWQYLFHTQQYYSHSPANWQAKIKYFFDPVEPLRVEVLVQGSVSFAGTLLVPSAIADAGFSNCL